MNVRGLNSNIDLFENLFLNKCTDNLLLLLTEIFEPSRELEINGLKAFYLTCPKKSKIMKRVGCTGNPVTLQLSPNQEHDTHVGRGCNRMSGR